METIDHLGQTYVKATALAKKYKYTTDYIGQLCRQEKVTARLVGRAWFVVEDSLVRHKSDRYAALRSAEIISKDNTFLEDVTNVVKIKREVYPRISKSTFKQLSGTNFENRVNHPASVFSYNADTATLDPLLQTESAIPVVREKQQKLKIHLVSNAKTDLSFEDIPEVSLSGSLDVVSDEFDLEDYAAEALSASDFEAPSEEVAPSLVTLTKRYAKTDFSKQVPQITPPARKAAVAGAKTAYPAPVFVPRAVTVQKSAEVVIVKTRSIQSYLVTTFLFCLFSVSSLVLIFGLTLHLEFDGSNLKQSLKFSSASVVESARSIPLSY